MNSTYMCTYIVYFIQLFLFLVADINDKEKENTLIPQGSVPSTMFTHVLKLVSNIWSQISSGTVTVGIIKKLQKHEAQITKLFDACPKELGVSIDAVHFRIQELNAYNTHRMGIHHFCSSFSMPVKGTVYFCICTLYVCL